MLCPLFWAMIHPEAALPLSRTMSPTDGLAGSVKVVSAVTLLAM